MTCSFFSLVLPLDRVAERYRAMDERRAIKAPPHPEGERRLPGRWSCIPGPPEYASRSRRRNAPVQNDELTVDHYMLNSNRVLIRVIVRTPVTDIGGIKDSDVRHHSRAQNTSVIQAHASSGPRCHFPYCVFQCQQSFFANVLAEDAWKRSPAAWMGFRPGEWSFLCHRTG